MTKLAESESWANGWADQNIFHLRRVFIVFFFSKKKFSSKASRYKLFFFKYKHI